LANMFLRLGIGLAAICMAPAQASPQAAADDADLQLFAAHINRTPAQAWPGYGIYLGNGLILTAAHVVGNFADTKPHVLIAGQDLPASLVRQGSFEGVDLTLLSVDGTKLPVRLQMRRMPLCKRPSFAGEAVTVVIPEGTARSHVLPPRAIPADLRNRYGTVIADVATTGNSGSGVFDVRNECLLGIMSRKISVAQTEARFGAPVHMRDIAKYFIPVREIEAFIPGDVTY
jgi:S1-C subfamily serine protease